MFEVTFTKKANKTFNSIRLQLFERWGIKTVIEFEKRTIHLLEIIADSPFIYQAAEINTEIRKALVHKNCSLYYKVKGRKVVLLFFWDNRQDPIL